MNDKVAICILSLGQETFIIEDSRSGGNKFQIDPSKRGPSGKLKHASVNAQERKMLGIADRERAH